MFGSGKFRNRIETALRLLAEIDQDPHGGHQRRRTDLTIQAIATIVFDDVGHARPADLAKLVAHVAHEEHEIWDRSLVVPPTFARGQFDTIVKTLHLANAVLDLRRPLDEQNIDILVDLALTGRQEALTIENFNEARRGAAAHLQIP